MARPCKEINWDIVEKRMEAGNSAATISSMHFIDTDTFYRRFKERYNCSFGDYSAKFHECGKSNIIFTQYMKALSGNTKMLELLGKEWCGQGKEIEKISPFEDILALRHENMILKAEIEEIKKSKEKSNANKSKARQKL